jgi:hypothetical protein
MATTSGRCVGMHCVMDLVNYDIILNANSK